MKKNIFLNLTALFAFLAIFAYAQESSVQFPIAELGNCESKEACAKYCDVPENSSKCLEFGRQNGLISETEARALEILPQKNGPGGCATGKTCREYCEIGEHLEECVAFAEKHDIGNTQELKDARKFLAMSGPGGCRGPKECKAYCENPENQTACLEFAEQNGFISKTEAEKIKKLITTPGPGGCRGMVCKEYCENPEHTNECLDFAESNGFISKEEVARIKKLALTEGPGGCKGRACQEYCENPDNQQVCFEFAEKNGLIPESKIQHIKKFINKTGPRGCRGMVCKEYCENPEHTNECLDFAESNGLMEGDELARAKKFMKIEAEGGPGGCRGMACKEYCEKPENRKTCFAFAKERGLIIAEDEEDFEIGEKLHEKVAVSGGPGGCKDERACMKYCGLAEHVEECVAFAKIHGNLSEDKAKRMLERFTEERFLDDFRRFDDDFEMSDDFMHVEEDMMHRLEKLKEFEEKFQHEGEMMEMFPRMDMNITPPETKCGKDTMCIIEYCRKNPGACGEFRDDASLPLSSDALRFAEEIQNRLNERERHKPFATPEEKEEFIKQEMMRAPRMQEFMQEMFLKNPDEKEKFMQFMRDDTMKNFEKRDAQSPVSESKEVIFKNRQEMMKRREFEKRFNEFENMPRLMPMQDMPHSASPTKGMPMDFQGHENFGQPNYVVPPSAGGGNVPMYQPESGFQNFQLPKTSPQFQPQPAEPTSILNKPDYYASFFFIFR